MTPIVLLLIAASSIFPCGASSQDGPFLRNAGTLARTQDSDVAIVDQVNFRGVRSSDDRKLHSRHRREMEENPWVTGASDRYAIMWAIIGGTLGLALLLVLGITYCSYRNNDSSRDRHLERRRRRLWDEMARNSLDTTFYEDVSSNF